VSAVRRTLFRSAAVLLVVAGGIGARLAAGDLPAVTTWNLRNGQAWLASGNHLVLLDGLSGRTAARIPWTGGKPAIAQDATGAYVVDTDAHKVRRIDGTTQTWARLAGGGETLAVEHVQSIEVGRSLAYTVQPAAGKVQAVDRTTLALIGDAVHFAGDQLEAAIGSGDDLWVLDRIEGRLHDVVGSDARPPVDLGWRNHRASLAVVAGRPVVVDHTAGVVQRIDDDPVRSTPIDCARFDSDDQEQVEVAGSSSAVPWLLLADPRANRVKVIDVGAPACHPIDVEGAGHQFGQPVEAGDHFWLPLPATGKLFDLDPREAHGKTHDVLNRPGDFEVIEKDDLHFINVPATGQVGGHPPGGPPVLQPVGGEGESGDPGRGLACAVDPEQAEPDAPVTFTATMAGTRPGRVRWRFGPGQESERNPDVQRFPDTGTYATSVEADGSTTACPTVRVFPGASRALAARIRVDRNPVAVDQRVTLRDASSGAPARRLWELGGDAEVVSGTDRSPEVTVVYHRSGPKAVALTVYGSPDGGEPHDRTRATVEVNVAGTPPGGGSERRGDQTVTASPQLPAQPAPAGPDERRSPCEVGAVRLDVNPPRVRFGDDLTAKVTFTPETGRCPLAAAALTANGETRRDVQPGDQSVTVPGPGEYTLRVSATFTDAGGSPVVRESEPVLVTVDPGEDQVLVPLLADSSLAEAKARLVADGLTPGDELYQPSMEYAGDQVVRTSPAADAKVARGDRVAIVLSQPAPTTEFDLDPEATVPSLLQRNVYHAFPDLPITATARAADHAGDLLWQLRGPDGALIDSAEREPTFTQRLEPEGRSPVYFNICLIRRSDSAARTCHPIRTTRADLFVGLWGRESNGDTYQFSPASPTDAHETVMRCTEDGRCDDPVTVRRLSPFRLDTGVAGLTDAEWDVGSVHLAENDRLTLLGT
jgi:hypothetical protein